MLFPLSSCLAHPFFPATTPLCSSPRRPKSKTHIRIAPSSQYPNRPEPKPYDDGIPGDDVKVLAKFRSRHNYIQVLAVSRRADHPLAGARLLLLDTPGNIHSISFLFKALTNTYFDVFATLPPILPPGPVAILGFGAGSASRLLLELYPELMIHGWELDPSVIAVGREYFSLDILEKRYSDRLFIYIGNALEAGAGNAFSGIIVDLFSKGSLLPELQDPSTWKMMKKKLVKGGRIMVNVAGNCVEPEDKSRDGGVLMKETLKAMEKAFHKDNIFVLNLGEDGREDSSLALTGRTPDWENWKNTLPATLKGYVDLWRPFDE